MAYARVGVAGLLAVVLLLNIPEVSNGFALFIDLVAYPFQALVAFALSL
jgi:hypothetical protein